MWSPGTVGRPGGHRAPCTRLARWVGPSDPARVPGTVGRGLRAAGQAADWLRLPPGQGPRLIRRRPSVVAEFVGCSGRTGAVDWVVGSGRVRLWLSGRRVRPRHAVFGAVGWRSGGHRGRGSAASRPHGPPDDGPGIARPGWSRSVGPPWSQWRRWWASHQAGGRSQPGTAQPPSRTTRAARWAGVTTRLVRPTSSGWVGAPPRAGGSRVAAVCSWAARLPSPPGPVMGVGPVAGDQDPGDRPITGQPPAGLGVQRPGPTGLTAHPTRVAEEAVQVDRHQQLGPHPTGLGELAGFQGAAGQLGTGRRRGAGHPSGCRGRWWGGPTAPGPPAGSGRPRAPTAPGGRPCPPRSATATAPAAGAGVRPGRRRRQDRRPAADG